MPRPREFDDQAVVEAAMQLFWTHGYAGTSPALLAEATGLGKGSLYNAFGSKRRLFDLALARYEDGAVELSRAYFSRPGTARDAIGAFLEFLVDTDTSGPVRRGCLAANTTMELAGHDREIATAMRASQERMITDLAARIQQGLIDGDVPERIDPRTFAEFLMSTIQGLRVMAKVSDREALHRIIDVAVNQLSHQD